ncbi:translocator protein, LysE family [Psychromonas sp. PRT-SC03]|nr:translocator protein, LysE family [Psychromonas sp. PRT-SC03]
MQYFWILLHVALIWMLAVATPGANVLLTINTALHYERKLAVFSALGVSFATLLWALFGGTGLVILFSHFPHLFNVMKIMGGSYLLYLGLRQIYITRKAKKRGELTDRSFLISPSAKKIFISAFITSILNPKTVFFVISLFSISMPAKMTPMMVFLVMMTMSVITLCWHLFLAILFSHGTAKNLYSRISGVMDYITGGLFTLFGIKIITS